MERIQTQQVVETVTLTRDGNEMTIPLESFADAVDRAMVLARISAVSRIPASLEWFGQEIQIPVTYFEIPLTDDPRNVFNHLRYYGIMTEYDDGGFPCLIKPIILTKEEFSFYLMRAQKEHRPLFSILWERFGNQNNATPQPSPRTAHKGTTYVNITIPSYVLDYLALEAKGNGITLSRQCCQVLERYCKMKIRKAAKYAPAEIEKAEEDKQEKQE